MEAKGGIGASPVPSGACHSPRRRGSFLVLLVVAWTFGYASIAEAKWVSDLGLMKPVQEAQIYQLGLMMCISTCLTWAVVIHMGLEESVGKTVTSVSEVVAPILACAAFMVVGPSLMLLNKHIMEEQDFPYPLTLSSLGVAASSAVAHIVVKTGAAEVKKETLDAVAGGAYWRTIFPIAAVRAVTLACGSSAYLYLSLGFIQMLKAFTPAMMLVVMVFVGVDRPTRPATWCVLIIVSGTVVAVNGEMRATVFGLLVMLTSTATEAVNSVLTQKLLQNMRFSEWETMYFLSPPSFLVVLLPAVIFEWQSIVQNDHHMIFLERPMMMLAAAFLGIGVNFLTLIVTKATSSVTVKVLNVLRCIGLVAVGMLFYGETRSSRQLLGYALSLVGFVGYNFFQLFSDSARAFEAWVDQLAASCFCLGAGAAGSAAGGDGPASPAHSPAKRQSSGGLGGGGGGSPASPTPKGRRGRSSDLLETEHG